MVARHQGVRQSGDQPQVYELLREVVQQLGGRVDHVIVSDIAAGMYAARVVVSIGGDVRVVRAKAAEAAATGTHNRRADFCQKQLVRAAWSARRQELSSACVGLGGGALAGLK